MRKLVSVITEEGVSWMNYTTDSTPRIGEQITTLTPENKRFTVLSVDHLVSSPSNSHMTIEKLVTVRVRVREIVKSS